MQWWPCHGNVVPARQDFDTHPLSYMCFNCFLINKCYIAHAPPSRSTRSTRFEIGGIGDHHPPNKGDALMMDDG